MENELRKTLQPKVSDETPEAQEARLLKLIEQGVIKRWGNSYSIEKSANKVEDILSIHDRFENAERFPAMLQKSMVAGMVDGIRTYRRELAKLGPMYDKGGKIGDAIIQYIASHEI